MGNRAQPSLSLHTILMPLVKGSLQYYLLISIQRQEPVNRMQINMVKNSGKLVFIMLDKHGVLQVAEGMAKLAADSIKHGILGH